MGRQIAHRPRSADHAVARERSAPIARVAHGAVIVLYALTLALGAALIFLLEPMFARLLLPLLGGTPEVWSASVVFFQAALLAGYAYAHWSNLRLGLRTRAIVHLVLVAAAALTLPVALPGWEPPTGGAVALWVMAALAVSIGLPFFIVASTGPLLQRWLAATSHPDAADPYHLFRASNVGSLIGLLAYPVIVERSFGLEEQQRLWSLGYLVLGLLLAACAVVAWRMPAPSLRAGAERRPEPLTVRRRLRWIALAAVPSSLMLAVTSFLTLDVAPVPLLWVLPLSLYLLSFIVVFSRARRPPFQQVATVGFPPLVVALAFVVTFEPQSPLILVGAFHLVVFFVAALLCHGQLAADRPPSRQLTSFYVYVALGGVAGSLFNVLVAPLVFTGLTEYPLMLAGAALCLPWGEAVGPASTRRRDVALALAVGAAVALVIWLRPEAGAGALIAAAVICLAWARRPLRFGVTIAAVLIGAWLPGATSDEVLGRYRSFFGVKRVEAQESGTVHALLLGSTLHGAQFTDQARALEPTAYFHRSGPLGQLLTRLAPDRTSRTAVLGLGTGTMACYSRPGDRWTFLEVDPDVVRIARDPRLFTYLRDCAGNFDVRLGDGRRSLASARRGEFGVIVLDAFSSDAVPVHLLTRDAMVMYRERLDARGILVYNISNRYLDLEPVLGNVARDTDMACLSQMDRPDPREAPARMASRWVVVARRRADLGPTGSDARWHQCATNSRRTWTDDLANVFSALR